MDRHLLYFSVLVCLMCQRTQCLTVMGVRLLLSKGWLLSRELLHVFTPLNHLASNKLWPLLHANIVRISLSNTNKKNMMKMRTNVSYLGISSAVPSPSTGGDLVPFELVGRIQPPPVCGGLGIRVKTFHSEPAALFVSMFPDFALACLSGEGQVVSVTRSKVRKLSSDKTSRRHLSACDLLCDLRAVRETNNFKNVLLCYCHILTRPPVMLWLFLHWETTQTLQSVASSLHTHL